MNRIFWRHSLKNVASTRATFHCNHYADGVHVLVQSLDVAWIDECVCGFTGTVIAVEEDDGLPTPAWAAFLGAPPGGPARRSCACRPWRGGR